MTSKNLGRNKEPEAGEGDTRCTVAEVRSGKLVGRSQAARLLGVSKSTVRRMEGHALTPVVGPNNVRMFREEQVQSLIQTRHSETSEAPRLTGNIAADVFELLDESLHPVDVVKRLRIQPELVETIHQHWCRLRGLLVLSTADARELHDMLYDGTPAPPTTAAELLALAQRWVIEESHHHCKQCRAEHAAFCRSCAKAWGASVAQHELAAQRARRI